jgi:hypothetical protein
MGVNLVWVCQRHRRYHHSMRGEEGIDFQALISTPSENSNECPAYCFRTGNISVHRDADFDTAGLTEWWPVWEQRPAELRRRHGAQ